MFEPQKKVFLALYRLEISYFFEFSINMHLPFNLRDLMISQENHLRIHKKKKKFEKNLIFILLKIIK
jgi:hypothetical protein